MRVFAIVAFGLWSSVAQAGELELKVEAVDFDMSQELAYRVRTVLTRMYAYFDDTIGLSYPARFPLRVRIIENRAVYDAVGRNVMRRPESTLGFFSTRTGGVVWRNPDEQALQGTLVHEAAHHMMAEGGGRAPLWLSEGIAEVFERHRVKGNAVWLDLDPGVLAWLRKKDAKALPSMAWMLSASRSDWVRVPSGPIGSAARSYGWSIAAFLMSTPNGKRTLAEMVRQYTKNREPSSIVEAAESTYRGGIRQMDWDWKAWWQGSPKALQLPIRAQTSAPKAVPTCDGILMREGTSVRCVK